MNKFCVKCGSKLQNGQNFCSSCGNVVRQQKSNKKTPKPIVIIGSIMAFCGFYGLMVNLVKYSNNLPTTNQQIKEENKVEEKDENKIEINDEDYVTEECYATLDKFYAIKIGMSYEEVVSIVGCNGTLSSDVGSDSFNIKMYYWYGKDHISNMVLSFQNNKLTGKNQIALN